MQALDHYFFQENSQYSMAIHSLHYSQYLDYLLNIQKKLEPLYEQIATHPLFESIHSIEELKIFTEHHVFAVWDFMCLLKTLQMKLTTVTVPWFPPLDSLGGRLINEILAEEEGDIVEDGRYLSHFELYIEAMKQLNADTSTIHWFLQRLKKGCSIFEALESQEIPLASQRFVKTTFSLMEKKIHQITAAFVFGRENITYKMFQPMLNKLSEKDDSYTSTLKYYLKRHIELDGDSHTKKGFLLLANLCQHFSDKWLEVEDAAIEALKSRVQFLDGIYRAL